LKRVYGVLGVTLEYKQFDQRKKAWRGKKKNVPQPDSTSKTRYLRDFDRSVKKKSRSAVKGSEGKSANLALLKVGGKKVTDLFTKSFTMGGKTKGASPSDWRDLPSR